jgi:transcriptional regulator with XRE-family HTH domain
MNDRADLFSARLNALFQASRRADGRRYTQEDVVRGCNGALTRVYLWKLRTGKAKNPSMRVVQALADFFGVSVDYFSTPGEWGEIGVERGADDPLVARMCEKYGQLDEQGKLVILNLVDYLLELKR